MEITGENILLVSSILLIAGVLIGKSSYRTGLPLLLIFLFVGMLFGTDGLGVHFSDMHTAQFVGMIALCVILFSGGLSTSFKAIRPVIGPGLTLATLGVLITALLTGLFIFWLSGAEWTNIHFSLISSLLLASTMSSTDSASVFGILGGHNIRLRENLRPMLELESGSNDPMAYMLTILLISCSTADGSPDAWSVIFQLILQFGVGTGLGVVLGWICVRISEFYMKIGKKKGEDSGQATAMISIILIAFVFLTFTLTTLCQGNGYLAVYLVGIIIGNSKIPLKASVTKFMNGITWLAQIVVFIMLGLLVNPHEMLVVAPVSILIGAFMIIVGRPVGVFMCLAPFRKITNKARMFVSWVGLRGAVPIIFATYPVIADVPGASQIFNIVFFVTILSLIVQGTSIITAAKKLNLVETGGVHDESFGVELADDHSASLQTIILSDDDLANGNTLRAMQLPEGTLVMMIRRDDKYIIPNGKRRLLPGDALLLIKENDRKPTKYN